MPNFRQQPTGHGVTTHYDGPQADAGPRRPGRYTVLVDGIPVGAAWRSEPHRWIGEVHEGRYRGARGLEGTTLSEAAAEVGYKVRQGREYDAAHPWPGSHRTKGRTATRAQRRAGRR